MIPTPPGSDSACRAGNGFQISKTRKSIKPSNKYFQLGEIPEFRPKGFPLHRTYWLRPITRQILTGGNACLGQNPPKSRAKCCPETSSITTFCGSVAFQYL